MASHRATERLTDSSSAAEKTARFDEAYDPTIPAVTPGPVVQALPRSDGFPSALAERFRSIHPLGSGGMGVVYRAHDTRLGRDVALKLLRYGEPQSWAKVIAEAQAQARVEHDHVCRIYDVGEAGGEPFIVMQLIEGKPFSIAGKRMDLRQRIEIVQKVAGAVHAAHGRGLVHRDIKPANILVEQRDDGLFRPYVVDFGIAQEIQHKEGQATSSALGTPAYMAPEMAVRGEKQHIDPRVDVYALGATLYDVIAGRAPYIGQDAWDILEQLGKYDPPALRTVAKRAPAEIEAIVMKCLERDPTRRYSTAGEVADDLQRYLAGEPIAARRVGFVYHARRIARSHGYLIISAAAISTLLVAFGVMRQRAKAQADVARDIGRTVSEMELYMRTAYQLPAHDIERERAVVRARIAGLEKGLSENRAGDAGATFYALGRAYLATGDDVRASEYLEQAAAAGFASPEFGYALAIARLGTYREKKMQAQSFGSVPEQVEAEIKAAETRYLKPALEGLRTVEPGRIEHPAYAAAIVAFYEGRHREAVDKAREAFIHAPLLYEAKKLEADALTVIATESWTSGEDEWWARMSAQMEKAYDAYADAENIARSDPRTLQACCGMRTRLMYAAFSAVTVPTRPYYDAARDVCDRLVVVDPSSGAAHTQRAAMYGLHAFGLSWSDRAVEDPLPSIKDAVLAGEEALRHSNGALPAYIALGDAMRARALVLLERGQAAREAFEEAEKHFAEGIGRYKFDASLIDANAYVKSARIRELRIRGVDIGPLVEQTDALLAAQIARKQYVAVSYVKRARIYIALAEQQAQMGKSPKEAIEAAFEALKTVRATIANYTVADLLVMADAVMAQYELDSGNSARKWLDQSAMDLKELQKTEADTATFARLASLVARLEAEERIRANADPHKQLESARKSIRRAIERSSWRIRFAIEAARVELTAANHAMGEGRATLATFESIRAPLGSWMIPAMVHPEAYAIVGESHALKAQWQLDHGESLHEAVAVGHEMIDRALATNPRHAEAWITRGRLWLLHAKASKAGTERADAAKKAVAAFDEAFRANPLLERNHKRLAIEARGLS